MEERLRKRIRNFITGFAILQFAIVIAFCILQHHEISWYMLAEAIIHVILSVWMLLIVVTSNSFAKVISIGILYTIWTINVSRMIDILNNYYSDIFFSINIILIIICAIFIERKISMATKSSMATKNRLNTIRFFTSDPLKQEKEDLKENQNREHTMKMFLNTTIK